MEYLTVNEVAKILRVQPQTIYLWATKKRMPSQKVCGALRFDKETLDHWLKTQKREVIADEKENSLNASRMILDSIRHERPRKKNE